MPWSNEIQTLEAHFNSKNFSKLYRDSRSLITRILSQENGGLLVPYLRSIAAEAVEENPDVDLLSEYLTNAKQAASLEDTTNFYSRIEYEENLTQDIEQLNLRGKPPWKIIYNFIMRGRSYDFKTLNKVHSEIKNTPLTREGRTRLNVKHSYITNQIIPTTNQLIAQFWPVFVIYSFQLLLSRVIQDRIDRDETL